MPSSPKSLLFACAVFSLLGPLLQHCCSLLASIMVSLNIVFPSSRYFVSLSLFCVLLCASVPCDNSLCGWSGLPCGWGSSLCGWSGLPCSWGTLPCGWGSFLCGWSGLPCGWVSSLCGWSGLPCGWGSSLCGWSGLPCGWGTLPCGWGTCCSMGNSSCLNSSRPLFDELGNQLSDWHDQSQGSLYTIHGLFVYNPCGCVENSILQVPVHIYEHRYGSPVNEMLVDQSISIPSGNGSSRCHYTAISMKHCAPYMKQTVVSGSLVHDNIYIWQITQLQYASCMKHTVVTLHCLMTLHIFNRENFGFSVHCSFCYADDVTASIC